MPFRSLKKTVLVPLNRTKSTTSAKSKSVLTMISSPDVYKLKCIVDIANVQGVHVL